MDKNNINLIEIGLLNIPKKDIFDGLVSKEEEGEVLTNNKGNPSHINGNTLIKHANVKQKQQIEKEIKVGFLL